METILAHPDLVIVSPEEHRGIWRKLHPMGEVLHLEIGMGKGQFLIEMAKRYPHILFLGLEKEASVLKKAIDKVDVKPNNLWFILGDASDLCLMFDSDEVDTLYLNFSDPWPKKRHSKRRLTDGGQLVQYQDILVSNGSIYFKTDNRHLFEFSIQMFTINHWRIEELSLNLHEDQDNIVTTEYEDRFTEKGNIIYYVRVKKWKE